MYTTKIPDVVRYTNPLIWLRHRLIQLLAGKLVIMLNARMRIIPRHKNNSIGTIDTGGGCLISNCDFPCLSGTGEGYDLVLSIKDNSK